MIQNDSIRKEKEMKRVSNVALLFCFLGFILVMSGAFADAPVYSAFGFGMMIPSVIIIAFKKQLEQKVIL